MFQYENITKVFIQTCLLNRKLVEYKDPLKNKKVHKEFLNSLWTFKINSLPLI